PGTPAAERKPAGAPAPMGLAEVQAGGPSAATAPVAATDRAGAAAVPPPRPPAAAVATTAATSAAGGAVAAAPPPPSRPPQPRQPPPRPPAREEAFKAGDHVVYPTHGVGTVQGIETVEAAGMTLRMIVVTFDENRMTLKVPVEKAASAGLSTLA